VISGYQGIIDGPCSDISIALGMNESIFESRAYQKWYGLVPVDGPPPEPEDEYQ
jgi:hypothetical protein